MGSGITVIRRRGAALACVLVLGAASLQACAGRQVEATAEPLGSGVVATAVAADAGTKLPSAPALTITDTDAPWLQGWVIYTGGVSGRNTDDEESSITLGTARGVVTLRGSEAGAVQDMVKKLVASLRELGIDARAEEVTGRVIFIRIDTKIDRCLIAGTDDLSLDQTSGVRILEDETAE